MMKNEDVAKAWKEGRRARGSSMWTDGNVLYSYELPIGVTTPRGKTVIRYLAPHSFVSMTTSKHVGIALGVCDYDVDAPQHGRAVTPEAARRWACLAAASDWTENKLHANEAEIAEGVGLKLRPWGATGIYTVEGGDS